METKMGKIKIASENMMPIIKKWLYSDKDIFLREIVANGVDAITKYKKLVDLGEATATDEKYCIKVTVDESTRTLTVEDNGIGMTAEEVEKYITQIAFSGAQDFLHKYENASGDGIIGHFGLGFYSAYMVSDRVEIVTKSYKDAPAVAWESDGEDTYTLTESDKAEHGTKIIMHIAEGEDEFLKQETISALLKKYCSFMPFDIYLNGSEAAINNTTPLYLKKPTECSDEEYKEFYKQTFNDFKEPLFWIHLNMEYPFRLKGILYFPQIKKDLVQLDKGQVKLYCNQVFIADNIKEVIPEFLMLLNGVIDCPDIPLNVSRSFLQNDRQVQKISKHITKKVADKLTELYNTERERYEQCWEDLSTFVKFGCIREEDFYEKVEDILIFKNLQGEYKPLKDYAVSADADKQAQEITPIYYVSDAVQQAQYVQMFKDAGVNAIYADTMIDTHFVQYLEYKQAQKWRFVRIDADIDNALKGGEISEEDHKAIVDLFKAKLVNTSIQVRVEQLKNGKIPAVITVDEFMRRMGEMQVAYGMEGFDPMQGATLVLNLTNPVVSSILTQSDEKQTLIVNQIYYLAMLSYKKLTSEELSAFVEQSTKLLYELTK